MTREFTLLANNREHSGTINSPQKRSQLRQKSSVPLPAPPRVGYLIIVRTLLASALVLLACGCADRSSRPSGVGATPSIPDGPDPVVLRIPQAGGLVVAYAYPRLDSALWRSSVRAPSLNRVIAFGAEDGYVAAIDADGAPIRIDLRLGAVSANRGDRLQTVSSVDGSAIYALTSSGELTRYTTSGGDWKFKAPLPAAALFAQADGALIVAGAQAKRVVVWRVRPPGQTVADSLSFDAGGDAGADAVNAANAARTISATAGTVGDRVYFGANQSVIAVRSRDMKVALNVDLGDPIRAIAATPSGDRLFVALNGQKALRIVDRFNGGVTGKIKLPAESHELRMDPLGRLLLAHGAGDTVYVISLGSDALQGVVHSAWRGDLPLVMADGAIALARGDDVVFTNTITLGDARTIAKGARDFWYAFRWNGFRPRSAGLDQPVQFRTSAPRDSFDASEGRVARDTFVKRDSAASSVVPPPADSSSSANDTQFTVSFAAVLDEKMARSLASRIRVDGQAPRITTSERAGKTLYRVVLGPYSSRDQAERVGKSSGQSYWVFKGAP